MEAVGLTKKNECGCESEMQGDCTRGEFFGVRSRFYEGKSDMRAPANRGQRDERRIPAECRERERERVRARV